MHDIVKPNTKLENTRTQLSNQIPTWNNTHDKQLQHSTTTQQQHEPQHDRDVNKPPSQHRMSDSNTTTTTTHNNHNNLQIPCNSFVHLPFIVVHGSHLVCVSIGTHDGRAAVSSFSLFPSPPFGVACGRSLGRRPRCLGGAGCLQPSAATRRGNTFLKAAPFLSSVFLQVHLTL